MLAKIFTLFISLAALGLMPSAKAQFSYTTNNGAITITGYTSAGSGGTGVTIPTSINGYPVTSIGGAAFAYWVRLTSMTIPNSVTSIGEEAFYYCTSLTNITVIAGNPDYTSTNGILFNQNQTLLIQFPGGLGGSYTVPNSVTSIEAYAFAICLDLTNVVIPNAVTNIGESAFYDCPSLTSITIPNSVISIGEDAFESCVSLSSINIPNSVTSIGVGVFGYCTNLSNVTIPNSITSIEADAFEDCTSLTNITFLGNSPGWVNSVFYGVAASAMVYYYSGTSGWSSTYDGLPTVELHPLYPFTYTTNSDAITITGYAGPGGAVTIPASINGYSVSSVGVSAFQYCTNLTNVTIPNSVTSIGGDAFLDCISLTSVTIPNSVTSIGEGAFDNCTSLTNITVVAGDPDYISTNGVLFDQNQTTLIQFPGGLGGSYTIPNSVTSIGEVAFCYCANLTSVTIGNNVTSIGEAAFGDCNGLTNITFLGNTPNFGSDVFFGVATGATVYYYYGTIGWSSTYAGLPTVELYPLYPFTYTTNSGAITITSYTGDDGAVTIPANIYGYPVTSVGVGAFFDCFNLTNVTIPNSVTNIEEEAFAVCPNLTSVIIPNSVISIEENAFYDCTGLTNITVITGNPDYSSTNGVLCNQNQTTLIDFPGGLGGSYTIPSNITSIGTGAFAACTSLTNVTIPNSVTSIGDYAFLFCSSLTSVTIGNSVTNIGDQAFYDCSSLTSVAIPNSVTTIGEDAFKLCTSLTSVTIGHSVTSIGADAFYDCFSLTNITFLGNAPDLDSSVFGDVTTGAMVYYYFGTSGWGATYGGLLTVELFMPPQIGGVGSGVGVSSSNFSFAITGVSGQTIIVEASTNLVNWQPVWTNTLSGTSANFTDPQWKNYPGRFYRAQ